MVKRTTDSNAAARITCNLEHIEKAPCVEKFSLQREDRPGEPALDGKRPTDSATLLRLGKLYSRRTSESSPNYCTKAIKCSNYSECRLDAGSAGDWLDRKLFVPIGDSAFGQVVRREFHCYAITSKDADSITAKFAGQVGENGAVGI
jgi:hypothetical protein